MATTLNLANLKDSDAYIQRIKAALEQAVGQKIPIINIGKVKRVSGTSAVAVDFVFAGNQTLTLYVRAMADAFKAELNGKTIVLHGDFSADSADTFNAGVKGAAELVRGNQKKFEAAQQKQKVIIPKTTATGGNSVTAQLKKTQEQEAELDNNIADLAAQRDSLELKLEAARQQGNV